MKKSTYHQIIGTLFCNGNKELALSIASGDEWFYKMEKEKQKQYIKDHPNSRFAKQQKKTDTSQQKISYDKTTLQERMHHATYKDLKERMHQNLSKIKTSEPTYKKIKGTFNTEHIDTITDNAKSALESYSNYLAPDCINLSHSFITTGERILRKHVKEFSKSDAETINRLMTDGVNKLLHQEIESNRQQYTDHGIRHIVKNIQLQQKILSEFEASGKPITGRQKLLGFFSMLNHDVGYTAPSIRQGGNDGVKSSSEHKFFSKKITKQQKNIWNAGKIFDEKEYDKAIQLIETHDSLDLDDKDPVVFATRVADNFALFQKEKLPGMFRYINRGKKILLKMGQAAKDKNETKFKKLQKILWKEINNSNLNKNLKRDLKMSTKELSMMTPKFTMGALAGNIIKVEKKKDQPLVMTIKHNKMDSFLQKYFDMGQKQVKNIMGDYGIKDFNKEEYDLKTLRLKVEK